MERRNRLRLLHPWLEARVAQGNTEPALHNAIGKIYITLNREPLQFLQNNQFYEPAVIGAFCEKLDPHLAFEAYKSARGALPQYMIRLIGDACYTIPILVSVITLLRSGSTCVHISSAPPIKHKY